MLVSEFFEVYNHYLATGDTTQIMTVCDELEIFTSQVMGVNKTYFGEEAPEKFRASLNDNKSGKTLSINKIEHAYVNDNHAVYHLETSKGRKKTTNSLTLIMRDGKLVCFMDRAI